MNTIHVKDMIRKVHMHHLHKLHIPLRYQKFIKSGHLLTDSRFWAFLAMAAVTALVITLALLTRSMGGPLPSPIMPGSYIF